MVNVQDAIRKYGVKKLGVECGVSPQAVHKWLSRKIPAERVIEVERVTGVPRHELRPDLYPEG